MELRRARRVSAVALVACLSLPAASAATKPSVRVGPDYFGVNYPLIRVDSPAVREGQLEAIRAAGIRLVRFALVWRDLEPAPGAYDWSASDSQVAELARHRLRWMPVFALSPGWAATGEGLDCAFGVASAGTDRIGEYATAAGALAHRYGPHGTFWREHPELPAMPITTWEIWNEPNLRHYWCPAVDPAGYAELFVRAANAIKAAQPKAEVITGGVAVDGVPGDLMAAGEFLVRALAARPDLWQVADGVGAHLYPAGETYQQLTALANLRVVLTAAGVPKGEPIFATELGWGLIGPFDLTEQERAERYRFVTRRLPRTTCNVAMMNAHAWTTNPSGPVWDFDAGIADPITAALFPSAIAYRDSITLMRGLAGRQAPHARDSSCEGMPKLDRDGDGRADHRDYYPLDPRRWRGPSGWYAR